jgi:dolichol-phosphate mannosyltransferase
MTNAIDISILILAKDEWDNLVELLPEVTKELSAITDRYEIVVIDGGAPPPSFVLASEETLRIIAQEGSGYGNAFRQGIRECNGETIISIDADYSHPPKFIRSLADAAKDNDLVIASRYIAGGEAEMPMHRALLSRILSLIYSNVLVIPFKDLSSGYRAYKKSALATVALEGENFDVLLEVLVRLYTRGARITELPFTYAPRKFGSSHARIFQFGMSYCKTLLRCRRIRKGEL